MGSAAVASFLLYAQTFLASWALCRLFLATANLRRYLAESFLAREAGLMPLLKYFYLRGPKAKLSALLLVASLLVPALPPLLWQSVQISTTVGRTTQFLEGLEVNATWKADSQSRQLDSGSGPLDEACTGFVMCDLLNKLMSRTVVGPPEVLAASPTVPYDFGSGLHSLPLNHSRIIHKNTRLSWDRILVEQQLFTVGNIVVMAFIQEGLTLGNYLQDPLYYEGFSYYSPGQTVSVSSPSLDLVSTGLYTTFSIAQAVTRDGGAGPQAVLGAASSQPFQIRAGNLSNTEHPDNLTSAFQTFLSTGFINDTYWFFVNDSPDTFILTTCQLVGGPPIGEAYLNCKAQVSRVYDLSPHRIVGADGGAFPFSSFSNPLYSLSTPCSAYYTAPSKYSSSGDYIPLTNVADLLNSSAYCHNIANNLASLITTRSGMVSLMHTSRTYRLNMLYTLLPTLCVLVLAVSTMAVAWKAKPKDNRRYEEYLWVLLTEIYGDAPPPSCASNSGAVADKGPAKMDHLREQLGEQKKLIAAVDGAGPGLVGARLY